MRIAAIIGAAMLAVVAWYLLRERESSATPTPRPAATASVPRTATPPALPSREDADPTALVDTTHTAMQAIGRRCFAQRAPRTIVANEPDDTVGRLELKLHIRIATGVARVETADVVTTRRLRDDLRDCIVDASRAASWSVNAPDGTQDIVELFRMGDFVAVPGPDSPPSSAPSR